MLQRGVGGNSFLYGILQRNRTNGAIVPFFLPRHYEKALDAFIHANHAHVHISPVVIRCHVYFQSATRGRDVHDDGDSMFRRRGSGFRLRARLDFAVKMQLLYGQ